VWFWINECSHIYHFPDTRWITVIPKSGIYMCEAEAQASRDRGAKNGAVPFPSNSVLEVTLGRANLARLFPLSRFSDCIVPIAELPPAFRALQQRMLKTPGGDREMVEILALGSRA
jgi:hypothetical protein